MVFAHVAIVDTTSGYLVVKTNKNLNFPLTQAENQPT